MNQRTAAKSWLQQCRFLAAAFVAIALGVTAQAEKIPVKHVQLPMHTFMVTRSASGRVIARVEFTQSLQGDVATMRLTFRFLDGSIDDETTSYRQNGAFQLIRDHHVEKGPFFTKPVDFAVDAVTNTATSRSVNMNGKIQVDSKHMELPGDLANGIVGTLLLNVPPNTAPFRVSLLAPVNGGRLIHLLISPDGEQSFQMMGKTLKATVFRIHPELGGLLGVIAQLLDLQPKDVMVWVLEGKDPAVVRIVGQLGGFGPVVSSELQGTTFRQ